MASLIEKLRYKLAPNEQDRALQAWHRERTDLDMSEFDVSPADTVVEIGGYKGQWASDMFARYGCNVVTTEPVRAYADYMRRRFAKNPKITVQQVAVGGSTRTDEIFTNDMGSSTVNRRGQSEPIQVVDFSEWFAGLGIERAAVMIVNCEGGEYEVLPRMVELGLADRFDNLLIQFHPVGEGYADRREKIRRDLSRTHREVFAYPFVWELWGLQAGIEPQMPVLL